MAVEPHGVDCFTRSGIMRTLSEQDIDRVKRAVREVLEEFGARHWAPAQTVKGVGAPERRDHNWPLPIFKWDGDKY
jgi:NifB/MoaA-like Fe-S oxidoreductase